MASIRTRSVNGSPRYDVRYYDPTGKQRWKTFGRKLDAKAFAATVEADKLRGNYVDADAGKITFREHADRWVSNHYTDKRSVETIKFKLEAYIYPQIGARPLRSLKPSDISGLFVDLSGKRGKPLADSSRQELFRIVSAILTGAVDDELVTKNVARVKSVRKPKGSQHKNQPWDADRLRAVRAALPERYRILVNLGVGIGLRQGEIFGLAVEDIHDDYIDVRRQVKVFSNNRLTFDLPKYEKTRRVPITADQKREIDEYLNRYPAQRVELPWDEPNNSETLAVRLVVTTRERKALNKNYFNSVWKRAVIASGVDVTARCSCCASPVGRWHMMHVLRHTYASALLDAGESIVAIAENLGHADPAFTLRTYTHLMRRHDDRTRAAIGMFLKESA